MICDNCGEERINNKQGQCKRCRVYHQKAYMKRNEARLKEKTRERNKERYEAAKAFRKARKAELVEEMGGKCKRCGYAENNVALDFDHIDPTRERFGIGPRLAFCSMSVLLAEIAKCQLLCANCHRIRTFDNSSF